MRSFTLPKLFIFFAFVIICISCKNSSVKVGFLFPNMVNERYLKEKQIFISKINELGGEAIAASADNNDQLQIQQANELISKGVKVLILNSINLNTAAAIVRNARSHGVKVIAYDRLIKNCDLDFFLSFDNEKVGKLMAEYVIKIKPSGKYMLLGGDKADQNAIWVKEGQKSALATYINSGNIKIINDCYVEDWLGENARFEVKRFIDLSGSVPDVILSSYDGMSTQVIDLLKEHNLAGQVLITGQDAELPACRNIVKDYQVMTVYKPIKRLATSAAELAMKLAKNEKVTEINKAINNGQVDVPTVLLDPIVVDKNNLKSTVIADGYQSEKEVYSN